MGRFDKLVPEHIRTLPGYVPGKPMKFAEQESGVACIKLASNENPLGPSPRAVEAIRAAAPFVHLYPDLDAVELRNLLAARNDVLPEQVVITCGSSQFLTIMAHSLLAPGLNAVTSRRSFIVYPLATQAAGGTLKQVPTKQDGYDLEGILKAVDENTRIVYIANPNNPTGTMLEADAIGQFVAQVPPHVLVVLDEAYYEFARHFSQTKRQGADYTRSLEFVREERNVVVLRTFSKAQGLAGLRIGYGFGPAELISAFARVRSSFSISAVAEAAALAALEDVEHVRRTVENNSAGAAWLAGQLAALGLRPVPTWANFLYVELGEKAPQIAKEMENRGVIVRPLTGAWGAPQAIRITVGTPAQNERCIQVLKSLLQSAVATG
jgi:histidinol-phosphate aminotransferase